MRFFAVFAALVSAAAAETFTVVVGGNGTLAYNPSSVNVSNGDIVQFQFVSKNHTVTQSTFAAPCTAMASGVDSGFQAVPANSTEFPVWSFAVTNNSAPLWFYCRQTGHCSNSGMVFAINPTAAKSFADFQAGALATGNSSSTGNSSTGSSSSSSANATSSAGSAGSSASNPAASAASAAPSASQSAVGAASGSNGASSLTISATGLVTVVGIAVGFVL